MKSFKAVHISQLGEFFIIFRIDKGLIYLKGSDVSAREQIKKLLESLREKGALILEGNGGWFRVNIIKDNENITIGDKTINVKKTPKEEIDQIFCDFFTEQYKKFNYIVEEYK